MSEQGRTPSSDDLAARVEAMERWAALQVGATLLIAFVAAIALALAVIL